MEFEKIIDCIVLCDSGSQAINIMHFKHMLTQFYV